VAARLKLNGAEVYLDVIDTGASGDDLADHTRRRLGECSDLMAVVSIKTKASWWVPWEIGVATEKEYPLATYASENCEIPEYLQKWPYLSTMAHIDQYVRVRQQAEQAIQRAYPHKTASARQPLFVKQFHASLKSALGQ
jgi:hypothetical protein